jgi:hypothetical protein
MMAALPISCDMGFKYITVCDGCKPSEPRAAAAAGFLQERGDSATFPASTSSARVSVVRQPDGVKNNESKKILDHPLHRYHRYNSD